MHYIPCRIRVMIRVDKYLTNYPVFHGTSLSRSSSAPRHQQCTPAKPSPWKLFTIINHAIIQCSVVLRIHREVLRTNIGNMASNQAGTFIIFLVHAIFLHSILTGADAAGIGVCYGRLGNDLPPPDQVVNLLKSYNIGRTRIFDADHTVLRALSNSGIEVIVGVGNNELQKIASDQAAADGWVNDNVRPFYPATKIKYIAVGNEVLGTNSPYVPYLVPAMHNIQTAIRNANLQNDIKVSTTHATSVLGNSYPPSAGAFSDQVRDTMKSILDFLAENGSPFMANVYPYFSYTGDRKDISLDYALFRSSNPVVVDQGRSYKNLFDALVDALISAMEKLGRPNIPIVVTESGWPSAGGVDVATVDNAQTYNNNLIKHVLSNDGTPKRPGMSIQTYIFALFNENMKGVSGNDETERHFGLFFPNKTPVYPVNFHG